jgi:hypothetical protein
MDTRVIKTISAPTPIVAERAAKGVRPALSKKSTE